MPRKPAGNLEDRLEGDKYGDGRMRRI